MSRPTGNAIDHVLDAIRKYESGEDRVLPSLKPGFVNRIGRLIPLPFLNPDKDSAKWEQDREDDTQSLKDMLMFNRDWYEFEPWEK